MKTNSLCHGKKLIQFTFTQVSMNFHAPFHPQHEGVLGADHRHFYDAVYALVVYLINKVSLAIHFAVAFIYTRY